MSQVAHLAAETEGRTAFGKFLADHGISYAAAARDLEITRSYAQSLGTGKSDPTIRFAAVIEDWTGKIDPENPVKVQSWVKKPAPK